jgi:hypothetical protein
MEKNWTIRVVDRDRRCSFEFVASEVGWGSEMGVGSIVNIIVDDTDYDDQYRAFRQKTLKEPGIISRLVKWFNGDGESV